MRNPPSRKWKTSESLIPLPSNHDTEEAVIGGCLLVGAVDEAIGCLPDAKHFYKETHKEIWDAMLALRAENMPIDTVSVSDLLKRRNAKATPYDVATLAGQMATGVNIGYHASMVREDSDRRELISTLNSLISMAYDRYTSLQEVLSVMRSATVHESATIQPVKETISRTMDVVENAMRGDEYGGVRTGIEFLDSYLGGWQPGESYLIAARPSTGKTALALYSAHRSECPVYFVSAEMSRRMIEYRLLAIESMIPSHVIKAAIFNGDEFQRLRWAEEKLKECDIYIDDKSKTPEAIFSNAKHLVKNMGVGVIFVDYLQILNTIVSYSNREREVAIISKSMKSMALELGVPVVALAQLNRNVEYTDRLPGLADLRESGSLEQDADGVIFLHKESDTVVKCILGKHRNGPTGATSLRFRKDVGIFEAIKV